MNRWRKAVKQQLHHVLLLLLALSLLLSGCTAAPQPLTPTLTGVSSMQVENTPEVTPTSQQALRILALGDSYTIGESVLPEERWPVQLALRLRSEGLAVEDPQIIARTGWTTDELAAALAEANPSGPFDLVTLLIGVNNQYRGRSVEEFRMQFQDLLQQALELAGNKPERVLVLSIPDWGVTPFAASRDRAQIAREIDAFNQVKREEAAAAGVLYVDITPVSRQAGSDETLLAVDGLHPSGKMYSAWVGQALPLVVESLSR